MRKNKYMVSISFFVEEYGNNIKEAIDNASRKFEYHWAEVNDLSVKAVNKTEKCSWGQF